jgi:peptidyl-prolyl cis-trans isomerase C
MKLNAKPLAATLACLLITACHFGNKAPTGQVVATVDGQEITLRELNAELAGVNVSDPKQRRAAQDSVLQSIISRKALAKAAREQGIDKSADYALQRDRGEEQLLAQFLQNKTAAAVPPPTTEEVNRFIADNPDLFGQRKIFVVDQIRTVRPTDPETIKQLQPLKTLDEVAAFFTSKHVQFARSGAELDADALGPQITAAILKLPPSEVFVVPDNNIVLINQIKSTRIDPLTGKAAANETLQFLKQQRLRQAVGRAMNAIIQKAAATVAYNPTYAPQKKPAAPAAAASSTPAK